MRRFIGVGCLVVSLGCGSSDEGRSETMTRMMGTTLDEGLNLMDAELDAGASDGTMAIDTAADMTSAGDADLLGEDFGENTPCETPAFYASEVVSFEPGMGAGFGEADFPDVVLGSPEIGPPTRGALDVLSLGVGGEIILGFGDGMIVDGPGPDFVVWENAFWIDGDPEWPFAELGEVSVSEDGEEWHRFECGTPRPDAYDLGCAGWRPRLEFDPCTVNPLQPEVVGGDQFDLAELGLDAARYIRIRDLSEFGSGPSAGFDLDAAGAIHFEP